MMMIVRTGTMMIRGRKRITMLMERRRRRQMLMTLSDNDEDVIFS